MDKIPDPESVSDTYKIPGLPIYVVGTFADGVTVRSQQIRALNLVWALIESQTIPSRSQPEQPSRQIAIIGGGFAGLCAAAGLIRKGADAAITIFEQCDTLLPLQQGSDSRWLHPHIYNWPSDGSDANSAMLPVMNWTAARASDVAVQILLDWKKLLNETKKVPHLYCNARHLQIHDASAGAPKVRIEWVGENRNAADGTTLREALPAVGQTQEFDAVILAVGFGQERDGANSYWRNETFAQPSLDQTRLTYLVSGQGDGAMIDLLRLRISQFRQDRILGELFDGMSHLLTSLKKLQRTSNTAALFDALESLSGSGDFECVRERLGRRLRRDTEVILHLKVKKVSELFDPNTTRISFQNKLLVYLLYKCGGFYPSSLCLRNLMEQHGIPDARVIRRHGTLREKSLGEFLPEKMYAAAVSEPFRTKPPTDRTLWPGGYFGFPGRSADASTLSERVKGIWRKEYLPGPTALLATGFSSALAGMLLRRHASNQRLRVTLHRAISFGDEELLQQACDYVGTANAAAPSSAAARTFPAQNATIGLAYRCRQIVRSRRNVDPLMLNTAMQTLNLNQASREMAREVRFVLAIPLLESHEKHRHYGANPVVGVAYIDSTDQTFFVDDEELETLVSTCQQFLNGVSATEAGSFDRIQNTSPLGLSAELTAADSLPESVNGSLELVTTVVPPATAGAFCLNFDYSDFVPIRHA